MSIVWHDVRVSAKNPFEWLPTASVDHSHTIHTIRARRSIRIVHFQKRSVIDTLPSVAFRITISNINEKILVSVSYVFCGWSYVVMELKKSFLDCILPPHRDKYLYIVTKIIVNTLRLLTFNRKSSQRGRQGA